MITFFELNGIYITYDDLQGLSVNEGQPLASSPNRLGGGNLYAFQEKPLQLVRHTAQRVAVGVRLRNNQTINIDDFFRQEAELLEHYEEDVDIWDTLEDEFEYRKFMQNVVERIYEEIRTTNTIEFEIVSLEADGDIPVYTRPLRLSDCQLGKKSIALWNYKPSALDLCIIVGKEYEFVFIGKDEKPTAKFEWSLPTHSADKLGFIQTYRGYAEYRMVEGRLRSCIGTLEECRTVHAENMKLLRAFWTHELDKLSAVKLTAATKGKVYDLAAQAKRNLDAIHKVDKAYKDSLEVAKIALNKIIGEVRETK